MGPVRTPSSAPTATARVAILAVSLLLGFASTGCDHSNRILPSPQTPAPPPPAVSATGPTLDPVTSPTAAASVTISGVSLQPESRIEVEGGTSLQSTTSGTDKAFSIDVPLHANKANRLFVTELFAAGGRSPVVAVEVVQDGLPPTLFIDFPPNGATLSTATTAVSGRVSDSLSGFLGLQVTVNGLPATVNSGIGTNGTFFLDSVGLATGAPTDIVARATDAAGNAVEQTITANFAQPTGNVLTLLSGNNQTGTVGSELPQPLVVMVTQPNGAPFAGKPVTFKVTRNDGRLATTAGSSSGQQAVCVVTDAAGTATAYWTLGMAAGFGNNRVAVTSLNINGTAYFSASATAGAPVQINVGDGNNQIAQAGGPATEPLTAWVSDTCNGAAGVDVTFTVEKGDGSLAIGRQVSSLTVQTSATGHASAALTLGPNAGTNVVEADFAGNTGAPARFYLRGIDANQGSTSLGGLVVDNAQQPIEGCTCTLTIGSGTPVTVMTDAAGQFHFDGLAASGLASLEVDGATAFMVGSMPIIPALLRFPALHFEPFLVANAANRLPDVVRLPGLDPTNDVSFDGSQDVTLRVDGMEGLEMLVTAGTKITLVDGTVIEQGSGNTVTLALNQVHADDVPMPMPDGAAPPFAWTLQPGGALFEPPVQITYPNMTGLAPGALAYFLSFDHDTNQFEIVATGAVTGDGSCIVSDPGAGIRVSGWGCNCPPYSVTGECKKCEGEPNGCGPAALGPIGPAILNCFLVPGIPPYTCFTPACNAHDLCYARKGASKLGCDGTFLLDMNDICDQRYGLLQPVASTQCKIRAAAYAAAVALFGGSAYSAAQDETCKCLGLPPASPVFGVPELLAGISPGMMPPPAVMFVDGDGDAIDDTWEANNGLDPTDPGDAMLDYDGDNLTNFGEFMNDLEVRNPDTDGNGVLDGDDVMAIQQPPPPTLDATWTMTVNGQTVPVDADGRFDLGNISAADSFGPAGPGSSPDFLSDDAFRVVGTSTSNGVTTYAFSDPFQIASGQTYNISNLTVTQTPPPIPVALRVSLAVNSLRVGETTNATTIATLAGGTMQDVTPKSAWTTYRSSSAAVATVSEDGLVTAAGPGTAFITATNEGVASVAQVVVSVATDPFTTLIGFVEDENGTRIAGATISMIGLPQTAMTAADGSYRIDNLPTVGVPQYTIRGTARIGTQSLIGTQANIIPNPGSITDAGLLVLGDTGGFGPIILSGMDPEDHGAGVGGAGWQMIQDIARFVVDNSALRPSPSSIVQLGGTTANAAILQSAVTPLGYTFTHITGPSILAVDFSAHDAVYMPTTSNQVSGGLSQADLDLINMRGADLITYANAGGGIAAFGQELQNSYAWFPLGGIQSVRASGGNINITTQGQFILSPSATSVTPFHVAFAGPAGYFGLDVLATESSTGNPLIIGGLAAISTR